MVRCALLLPLFLGFVFVLCVVVHYLVYFQVLHLMVKERKRDLVALLQLYF